MKFVIVGLGNPGGEYEGTRHNAGRMAIEAIALNGKKEGKYEEWEQVPKKKPVATISKGSIGKHEVLLVAPDLFMNNSGKAVLNFVKNKAAAKRMIVIYDDLDLPIGTLKFSFNKGSGGHKGLDSIMRVLKTREFARLRIGVAPVSLFGKTKKPQGEKEVIAHIMGKWKPSDEVELKKVFKHIVEAIETFITEGQEFTSMQVNSR